MMRKKKLAYVGLALVGMLATLAFGAGWRTYENTIWLGDPSSAGDRNIYFEIGNAPTNPALRWDNSDAVFKIAIDGSTFLRIPQQSAALTASEALVTNASGVLTTQAGVSAAEVGFLSSVTSGIQGQLNGKEPTIGLGANVAVITTGSGTLTTSGTTATEIAALGSLANSVVVITDGSGAVTTSSTTADQVAFINSVSSNVQNQLDGKEPTIGLAASVAVVSNGSGVLSTSSTTASQIAFLNSVSSNVQDQLDGKEPTIGLAASVAVVSNGSGVLSTSSTTASQIAFLNSVTDNVQDQLDGKEPTIALAASVAVVSNGSGVLSTSGTTATQISYLSSTTSDVQDQLDDTVKTDGNQTVAGIKNFTSVLGVNQAVPAGRAHITETTIAAGTINPDDNFDTIVLEDDSNAGISIFSVDTSGVIFGRFGSPSIGGVTYNHTGGSTDHMFFKVNGSNRAEIEDDGSFLLTVPTVGGTGCPGGHNVCSGTYSVAPAGGDCASGGGNKIIGDADWNWSRSGNKVTVWGLAEVRCGSGVGSLKFTLPISSAMTAAGDIVGSALRDDASEIEVIFADFSGDVAETSPFPLAENDYYFEFSYRIK